ncbi:class F sortase [Actinomycetospora flava]|uniref:Class F sortase n=1 Tax=Actinomycetospora flava TaxID=3129232 RepID=A0ABU8M1M2_9PSEU
MTTTETPGEDKVRRGGLERMTGRLTALVLAVLVVGVLVAVATGDDGEEGPRAVSLPPAERVSVALPLPPAQITGVSAPSIGLAAQDTTSLGLRDDNSLDVPRSASTVGWYGDSASPGTAGAAVLAAHVDFRGEEGAFARLEQLAPGATVEVHRDDDTTAVFTVDRVDRVAKDAFPTEAVYGDVADSELRLITCGGVFNERTRSYDDNIIVFARLTEAYRPV